MLVAAIRWRKLLHVLKSSVCVFARCLTRVFDTVGVMHIRKLSTISDGVLMVRMRGL